jgi:hypothetical protein
MFVIDRCAASSWCSTPEYSEYLVTGSIAGTLDFSSSESTLEFWSTGLKTNNAQLLGSLQVNERFNKLSWGNPLPNTFKYGIVAGSLTDGSIGIWDPTPTITK